MFFCVPVHLCVCACVQQMEGQHSPCLLPDAGQVSSPNPPGWQDVSIKGRANKSQTSDRKSHTVQFVFLCNFVCLRVCVCVCPRVIGSEREKKHVTRFII